mmetsp:Transcript_35382/g.69829  ORF Transcript_35382/g.69829 Transcript_35382/m.69829 type:complete len:127 (-) Transcript_35382:364-744(-)
MSKRARSSPAFSTTHFIQYGSNNGPQQVVRTRMHTHTHTHTHTWRERERERRGERGRERWKGGGEKEKALNQTAQLCLLSNRLVFPPTLCLPKRCMHENSFHGTLSIDANEFKPALSPANPFAEIL